MATKKNTAVRSKSPSWQKRVKTPYLKFKRLENRQRVVEQARRAVFAYLNEITHENIELAKQGNSSIAKFLLDFAGIGQIPALAASSKSSKKSAAGCGCEANADDDPSAAVLSFCNRLGMTLPKLKPPKAVEAEEAAEQPAMEECVVG